MDEDEYEDESTKNLRKGLEKFMFCKLFELNKNRNILIIFSISKQATMMMKMMLMVLMILLQMMVVTITPIVIHMFIPLIQKKKVFATMLIVVM